MNYDEVFTPETISTEALKEVFDAALFDSEVDDDGDLIVRDTYRIFVTLPSKERLRLLCVFGFRESSEEYERLAFVNKINHDLAVIRACLTGRSSLFIDWYLPVRGGLSKKTIVLSLRMFTHLIGSIGHLDTDDLIG